MSYDVSSTPYRGDLTRGAAAAPGRTRLPFPFPFAGKNWDEVYINVTGTLSFGGPEFSSDPLTADRETWPNGSIRWEASMFDIDAITGARKMIAPLWGLNSTEKTHVFVRSSRTAFTVTWQAVRHYETHNAYPPLGENHFQATLNRDGSIEFRYGEVDEKDGIVGIFCGSAGPGKVLDQVELPPVPGVDPALDLRLVTVTDDGADLHFSSRLAGTVPRTDSGLLSYTVAAISGSEGYGIKLEVGPQGRNSSPVGLLFNRESQGFPDDATVRTVVIPGDGSIEFYLPKIGLKDPARLLWKAENFSGIGRDAVSRTPDIREIDLPHNSAFGADFRRDVLHQAGSLYEVFAYPFVPKGRLTALQDIYQRSPANSEFAIVLTDFRIDDVHDAGASNGWDGGEPGGWIGAPSLLQAAGPIYMGPQFAEKLVDKGRAFHDYAFAVAYMAHEITHHWVATLKWKPPDVEALVAPGRFHWSPMLYTPVVAPVSKLYTDSPYPEESIMGGMEVEKLPNGSSHSVIGPWGAPTGLCPLDLYEMGLIPPEEVPDTFFIANAKYEGAAEGYKGGEVVPVTIKEIIAANGPPPKAESKRFRVEIYLLYQGMPDPAKVAQAQGMEAALCEYFRVATKGKMTVVPAK